ncbi:MAG: DUF6236 family protein [Pseudomonadota bacterium]
MAFTKALYYPYIDIQDSGWLKTSMLYWDEIQTIVPKSEKTPYKNPTTAAFHDAGILSPLQVKSGMREIEELTNDMLAYLNSPEALTILFQSPTEPAINSDSDTRLERIETAYLYPDKLPYLIRDMLEDTSQGWLLSEPKFGMYYMTLLACHLCEHKGISLLTDLAASDALAGTFRLNAGIRFSGIYQQMHYRHPERSHRRHMVPKVSEACLATLILESVRLDPDTQVNKIIKFRNNHRDELGRLRSEIGRLASSIELNGDANVQEISQRAQDILINELTPALNDLRNSLRGSLINFVVEKGLKVSLFSGGPTYLASQLLGLAQPQALFVSSAASFVASCVSYNVEKAEKLRNNPYSYLLSAQRFGAATRLAAQQEP